MIRLLFNNRRPGQKGNIFLALFMLLGLIGTAGAVSVSMMKGPVRGMSEVTRTKAVEADMTAGLTLLSRQALGSIGADCDNDGKAEPLPFRSAGALPKPVGGGYLPATLGSRKIDPWGTEYGYCAWDHGSSVLNALCGGAVGRLGGGDTNLGTAVAIISAGPDRTFHTTCSTYVNDATSSVNKTAGSDDIIKTINYEKFMLPSGGNTKLEELPDEACIPQNIGLMRRFMGIVQVCMDTGWEEVGTSAQADTNFVNVTNAPLGSLHTSNQITFSGFLSAKKVTVTGGTTLLVNNTVRALPATIVAGDKISLRANAAATPESTRIFEVSVGGVKRPWSITTRDFYPAALSITPNSKSDMNVRGPNDPAYGTTVSLLVRNTGELNTVALSNAVLSNTINFEFDTNGSFSGDDCAGKILMPNGTCVLDIRPKATSTHDRTNYSGNLSVAAGSISATATPLEGAADGWTCTPPWGGARINHGGNVTAYQTATVAYNATCVSQTRTCTADVLSGTYTHQSCAPVAALNCSAPWGATVNHGNSVTAYAAANVPFGSTCSSQTRTCTNGVLSGTYTASGCTVASPTYAYGAWSGWSGCSATCGGGTQTQTRSCLRQDGVASNCSLCGGVCSSSQSCNTHSCIQDLYYMSYSGVPHSWGPSDTFWCHVSTDNGHPWDVPWHLTIVWKGAQIFSGSSPRDYSFQPAIRSYNGYDRGSQRWTDGYGGCYSVIH